MSTIKQIQRRFFEEVWNKGQLQTAYELLAPTVVIRSFGRDLAGFDGVAEMTASLRSAFSNINFTVEEQIAEGDLVVARWTARGTNDGPVLGFPATGREMSIEGHTIDRIAGGRIVTTLTSVDVLEMLMQLGIEPKIDVRKALTQRMFSEVWSAGKLELIDELVAADAVVGSRGDTGPAAVRAFVKSYRDAIPDLTAEVLTQVAEGDAVTTTWMMRGHHRGELMGIPATGRHVTFTGTSLDHVKDGKITRTNIVLDVLELLTLLGAVVGKR